jgi:hypothetical protein
MVGLEVGVGDEIKFRLEVEERGGVIKSDWHPVMKNETQRETAKSRIAVIGRSPAALPLNPMNYPFPFSLLSGI